jgi:phosphoribosyl 1,2-cyclic phosphate phosphodiesterase
MEAIILGTAAAEGIPALFCGCEVCVTARKLGGKNIRGRQSLFLPPDILIDLGPDSMSYVHRNGFDYSKLAAILYTHSHDDHCQADELGYLHGPTFAKNMAHEKVLIYGNERVRDRIRRVTDHVPEADVRPAVPFETILLPGLKATPILSYHREPEEEETLNYILERGGKTLLYATDLGRYDEQTWEYFSGIRLDAVIMECTNGVKPRDERWPYHMSFPNDVDMKERMHSIGALAEDAPFCITHFSHNGAIPHDDFQALADPHGITVAWDGLRVCL